MDSEYKYVSDPLDASQLHRNDYARIHQISVAHIILAMIGLLGTILSCLVITGEHLYTVLAGIFINIIILSTGAFDLRLSRTYDSTAWSKNKRRLIICFWLNIAAAIFFGCILILLITAASIIPGNPHYLELAVHEVVDAHNLDNATYVDQRQNGTNGFFTSGINVGDSAIPVLISGMVVCGIFLLVNIVLSAVASKVSRHMLNVFFLRKAYQVDNGAGIDITVTSTED